MNQSKLNSFVTERIYLKPRPTELCLAELLIDCVSCLGVYEYLRRTHTPGGGGGGGGRSYKHWKDLNPSTDKKSYVL